MAAIVQGLERRFVVPNVEGSIPSSRPIKFFFAIPQNKFVIPRLKKL
jgi:hypothetical protein